MAMDGNGAPHSISLRKVTNSTPIHCIEI